MHNLMHCIIKQYIKLYIIVFLRYDIKLLIFEFMYFYL